MEDYTKYLSYDNNKGLLLNKSDVIVLKHYNIDYENISKLSELILNVEKVLEEFDDEELELVLEHLSEMYYYTEVNK